MLTLQLICQNDGVVFGQALKSIFSAGRLSKMVAQYQQRLALLCIFNGFLSFFLNLIQSHSSFRMKQFTEIAFLEYRHQYFQAFA